MMHPILLQHLFGQSPAMPLSFPTTFSPPQTSISRSQSPEQNCTPQWPANRSPNTTGRSTSFTIAAILERPAITSPTLLQRQAVAQQHFQLFHQQQQQLSAIRRMADTNHYHRMNRPSPYPALAVSDIARFSAGNSASSTHETTAVTDSVAVTSNNSSNSLASSPPTARSGGGKASKSKRVRTIFTAEQLDALEAQFNRQQYMVGPERVYLSQQLQLTEAQVKVWFQNRRIKFRKQFMEQQQNIIKASSRSPPTTLEELEAAPRVSVPVSDTSSYSSASNGSDDDISGSDACHVSSQSREAKESELKLHVQSITSLAEAKESELKLHVQSITSLAEAKESELKLHVQSITSLAEAKESELKLHVQSITSLAEAKPLLNNNPRKVTSYSNSPIKTETSHVAPTLPINSYQFNKTYPSGSNYTSASQNDVFQALPKVHDLKSGVEAAEAMSRSVLGNSFGSRSPSPTSSEVSEANSGSPALSEAEVKHSCFSSGSMENLRPASENANYNKLCEAARARVTRYFSESLTKQS